MKIIHCADLHLDSPLSSNFTPEKAAERRNELLGAFSDLADYARAEGVSAVIIAGDLFDRDRVSALAANTVRGVIAAHPEITFFYLRGNHDRNGVFTEENAPANLLLFGEEWRTYRLAGGSGEADLCVTGAEITGTNQQKLYRSLDLSPDDINIVILHGQLGASGSGELDISISELENKNTDYLALGHLHSFRDGKLPPSGVYCYPGCLEGRGFDEAGEHGFVLLDIDPRAGTVRHTFVPFAKRRFYNIEVNITKCRATYEMQGRILTEIRKTDCTEDDMLRITLVGEIQAECEKNVPYLEQYIGSLYYLVKIDDESRVSVDYQRYALDASLKGEFVRLVGADPTLSAEEKAEIVMCGFEALNEEDISI